MQCCTVPCPKTCETVCFEKFCPPRWKVRSVKPNSQLEACDSHTTVQDLLKCAWIVCVVPDDNTQNPNHAELFRLFNMYKPRNTEISYIGNSFQYVGEKRWKYVVNCECTHEISDGAAVRDHINSLLVGFNRVRGVEAKLFVSDYTF